MFENILPNKETSSYGRTLEGRKLKAVVIEVKENKMK